MTIVTTARGKAIQVEPYYWTRQEYEKMVEIGLFLPDARLELIEGKILKMAAHTSYHAAAIAQAQRYLARSDDMAYHIRVQLPLALNNDSEPEPDLAVVAGSPNDYWDTHPTTALLIVEVAYSSLEYDQDLKYHLYARCGIPEYWILNLNERRLEVYRKPEGEEYGVKLLRSDDMVVSPLFQPDRIIAIVDLLPRPSKL